MADTDANKAADPDRMAGETAKSTPSTSRVESLADQWRREIAGVDGASVWMAPFFEALEQVTDVQAAAVAARIDRTTAYAARKRCKWFADRWDEIVHTGVLAPARASFARRAIHGSPRAIWKEVEVLARNGDGSVALDGDGKPIRTKEWQAIAEETIYETNLSVMWAQRRLDEFKDIQTSEPAAEFASKLRDFLRATEADDDS